MDFAAPGSIQGQLREDDRLKQPVIRFPGIDDALQPWFDWKKELSDRHGLQVGVDYNVFMQTLDHGLDGEDGGVAGAFRVFGTWNLVGRGTENTGSLFMKVEHRHAIGTARSPAALGGEAAYLGLTTTNFSDPGLILGDLNWQQRLNGGEGGLIVGRFDPNDYVSVLGYANPASEWGSSTRLQYADVIADLRQDREAATPTATRSGVQVHGRASGARSASVSTPGPRPRPGASSSRG